MAKSGEARCDENGKTSYGQPGDQTGNEVSIADVYNNPQKPWKLVFRAKSEATQQKLAQNMKDACNNQNIGYAQYGDGSSPYRDRYGLYFALKTGKTMSGVTIPCNCDCSSLVAQCCILSGVNVSIYMSTSNEVSLLRNTGLFDEITYDPNMTFVAGDILWRSGHTGIIVEGSVVPFEKFTGAATTELNLRQGPGTQYGYCNIDRNDGRGIRHTLYRGEEVPVIDASNGWYNVKIVGEVAEWFPWCSGKYIKNVGPYEEPIGPGDTVMLKTNSLNASAAGLQGTVESIENGWYLVAMSDGCKGYTTIDNLEVK